MNNFIQPHAVRGVALLLAITLAGLPALLFAAPATEAISFAKDSDHASVKGKLKGPDDIAREYTVNLAAGQTLSVAVKDKKQTTFFNVFPPGAPHREGEGRSRQEVKANIAGAWTIRVFLTHGAAVKGESASYELTVKAG